MGRAGAPQRRRWSGRAALRRGRSGLPRDNREEHVVRRFGSLVVVSSVVAACVVGLAGVDGSERGVDAAHAQRRGYGQDRHRGVRQQGVGGRERHVDVQRQGPGRLRARPPEPGRVVPRRRSSAVQSHHGDINALTPFGSLIVAADAPGTIQTVLTPGNYVALNLTGNGPSANVRSSRSRRRPRRHRCRRRRRPRRRSSSASRGPRSCMTGRWCGSRTAASWCTWMS